MKAAVDDATLGETRAFNEDLRLRLAQMPPVHTVPPHVARQARRENRSIFPPLEFVPQARDMTIPTRNGEIRLRVLAPEREATGVYLHSHGGGWVLGDCDEQDVRLWSLVEATGLCAVSVGYRLAPEHPYPAAPDDCEDAALWLLEHGPRELGVPEVFTLGGESAGAHLSVTTLLRLRDRHGITGRFRAANLVYGGYDLTGTPSQLSWGDRSFILSTPSMEWFARSFAGDRSFEERRDPDISPLYAELHDLPPAYFSVGDLDPLLDDSLFMSMRWRAAGNQAELRVWPECVHAFLAFPLSLARRAHEEQHDFLRRALAD